MFFKFVTDPRNKRDTSESGGEFVEPLAEPGDEDPSEEVQKAAVEAKTPETTVVPESKNEEGTEGAVLIVAENNNATTTTTAIPPPTTNDLIAITNATTIIFETTTPILILATTTTPFGPEWLTLAELDDYHHRLVGVSF